MFNHYITYRRFHDIAWCGRILDINYGVRLESKEVEDGIVLILPDSGDEVCYIHSQNGHEHFAPNDDGKGLMRGELCWLIAFANREGRGQKQTAFRFNMEEQIMISEWFPEWLIPNIETLLFDDCFFEADVEDLQTLAQLLFMKLPKQKGGLIYYG